MEAALGTPFAPRLIPVRAELSENSRLGVRRKNPVPCRGKEAAKALVALGLRGV